jgi:hypothetical protein
MQVAGSASWRFEEGNSQLLHLALFIRDAAALPVQQAGDIPPPLASPVPGRADTVPTGHPDVTAAQWITWWRQLTDSEADEAQHEGRRIDEDSRTDARAMLAYLQSLFDPPEFTSLAGSAELRSLAKHLHEDAIEWSNRSQAADPARPDGGLFQWGLVRAVAEEVAAGHGVPVGAVRGAVQVLDVDGMWSCVTAPGFALCSAALATSPARARALLHVVFGSGLRP